MNIKELAPNLENPRKMSAKKLDMLKKSLHKYGDLSGFIYNKRTSRLVGGHQKQKVVPPDCKVIIEKTYPQTTEAKTIAEGYILINGERFKYREVDADEQWETEAMIAANKHSGEWDGGLLKLQLQKFPEVNFEVVGFEPEELAKLGVIESEENEKEESEATVQFVIAIECDSENQMQCLYEEFQAKGLKCKLIT